MIALHEIEFFIKVSIIENCAMKRQSDLSFDFEYGSCNSFLEPKPQILLCFDIDDPQVCRT